MARNDRINLFPSRANLVWMKQRTEGAQKGLGLLKRKRDALYIHLRQLSTELDIQRKKMNVTMQDAIFSMAKANFLCTDFKPASVINPNQADTYLRVHDIKLVGISVPTFQLITKNNRALKLTGLASGGTQVQVIREQFQEALKILTAVASLEYSTATINRAIRQTNMRVNALQYVILPRYQNTMDYIREELDELEREDFYRLKRSQAKQLKKKLDFTKLIRDREKREDAQESDHNMPHTDL